ncbi:hypothetical protein Tco_0034889, partial [Tanacetum coccineum]
NTARASGTKNVSTARHSFKRQAVLTSAAMKVNTVKPIVNSADGGKRETAVKPSAGVGITDLKITKPIRRNEERRNNEGPNM